MRKTLEDIAQHIEDVFIKEKPLNRYHFSNKYTDLFNDFVYDVSVANSDRSLFNITNQLKKPLFIFNDEHNQMFIISPIFALIFGINQDSSFEDINCDTWFSREFWDSKIISDDSPTVKISYETVLGDIPEFMACLKIQEDGLQINVLRCKHKINLDKDAKYLVSDLPPMFQLDHSDPIHLVRFLLSHQQDR